MIREKLITESLSIPQLWSLIIKGLTCFFYIIYGTFEATFSSHMSMFQNSFQLDTMTLASKSFINCFHITIPDNYKLGTFYTYVTRKADIVSGSHISPVDVASTFEILSHRPFQLNRYHNIKLLVVTNSGMNFLPKLMRNYYSDTECESDVEFYIELNVDEQVNFEEVDLSGVVPV